MSSFYHMSNVCHVVWLYSPMSIFVNMCYWFGVVGLCTLGLYLGVSICIRYICICQKSAMGICAFIDIWHWFSVVVFQRFVVNWGGGGTSAMGICAFFYMWHWTVEMWNCHSWPLDASTFFYMWHWFGVVVFQTSRVDWGYICHGYMCIHRYVTLIWCSGVPEIYGQLGGTSAVGICAFIDMCHWFGVVVFQRSMVN